MNNIDFKKISKDEFNKIDEQDVMFITNPVRMNDEDGSNFIILRDNKYYLYRVDGFMYNVNGEKYDISLDDMFEKFPLWKEAWNHCNDKNYNGKYKYVHMGFGNGLCIDKRIYDEFYPYMLEELKKSIDYKLDENGNYPPSLNYEAWRKAFENYIKKLMI